MTRALISMRVSGVCNRIRGSALCPPTNSILACCSSARAPQYKVNGWRAWWVTHAVLALCVFKFKLFNGGVVYDNWAGLFIVSLSRRHVRVGLCPVHALAAGAVLVALRGAPVRALLNPL